MSEKVYIPTEEVAIEDIPAQIQMRMELVRQMVGTLYPQIIAEEIHVLHTRLWQWNNEHPEWEILKKI